MADEDDADEALEGEALRRHGAGDGWTLGVRGQVRFGEIDLFGHVNHAAYMVWFEHVRCLYFRRRGLTDFAAGRTQPVLRALEVDYRRPLRLHDRYLAVTRVTRVGRTSFTMAFEARLAGEPAVASSGVFVMVDPASGKTVPVPEEVATAMRREIG